MFVKEILEATGGKLISGGVKTSFSGVSIDSRTLKRKEIFLALKGKNFDGHNFIGEAIKKGAKCIIVSKKFIPSVSPHPSPLTIMVSDTTKALCAIASYKRKKFNIPIIAITGSNGKTTVKELIAFLLSSKYNLLKSRANQNNCIGLSLNLLSLTSKHQIAVLEMGSNHFGELSKLGEVARPTIGVITNIGQAHLEFFKDIKGVYKAKMELLDNLPSTGTIVIDGEDEKLLSLIKERFKGEILSFDASSVETDPLSLISAKNIAAAFAVCKKLGMNEKEITERLKNFKNLPMRMEMKEIRGIRIINDAYNSNPCSLSYAIRKLAEFKGRKILVAGDMLELGKKNKKLHFEIGELVAELKIDILLTVGKLSYEIGKGAYYYGMDKRNISHFTFNSKAAEYISNIVLKGDIILIKGSREMKMEEIVAYIGKTKH